jgi:hypothetical protein
MEAQQVGRGTAGAGVYTHLDVVVGPLLQASLARGNQTLLAEGSARNDHLAETDIRTL